MDGTLGVIPSNDPFIFYAAENFPPYTTPALTANLVFRVALGILANLLCLVPLRLLYRNHELAAVVFIINIEFKNILTVASALIWRDDNMENWWAGYGLCDVASFANNFSFGLYDTCMLAIMRNLAHQANLLSAHPLSVREKRRRNLVHVLIMFPLPLLQVGWTWFLTVQRYVIGTLTGCTWFDYPSWPYLVFFALAPLVVSVVTVGYAGKSNQLLRLSAECEVVPWWWWRVAGARTDAGASI
jgi:pheromone a factor receptor